MGSSAAPAARARQQRRLAELVPGRCGLERKKSAISKVGTCNEVVDPLPPSPCAMRYVCRRDVRGLDCLPTYRLLSLNALFPASHAIGTLPYGRQAGHESPWLLRLAAAWLAFYTHTVELYMAASCPSSQPSPTPWAMAAMIRLSRHDLISSSSSSSSS